MSWLSLRILAPIGFLAIPFAAMSQTVTVSAVTGAANETSIQAAIASLAPGGSRDDGDTTNNVVQIIDSAAYNEALHIEGMGLTLEGTAAARPRIVTSFAAAAINSNNFAVRVDSDVPIVFRKLIFLPDKASPAFGAMTFDEFAANGWYTITLEDVVVAANNGADQPSSSTGRVAPGAAAVPYVADAIDFNSTPATNASSVTFRRTVVTAAGGGSGELVRFFTDKGTALIAEGCVFSFSNGNGVEFNGANDFAADWIGTYAQPIILHGNQGAAVSNLTASCNALRDMEYVAVTRNSLGANIAALSCASTAAGAYAWENIIVAGNSTKDGTTSTDGPVLLAKSVSVKDSIIAGDGMDSRRSNGNLIRINVFAGTVIANGVCVDISQGPTSLNVLYQRGVGETVDGVLATASTTPSGAGVTSLDPDFWSLDPASGDYLAIGNEQFQTLASDGGPLAGPGFIKPFALTRIATLSGNFQSYLEAFPVPDEFDPQNYNPPDFDDAMIFASIVDDIHAGRLQAAANKAPMVNYAVIVFSDQPSGDYHVLLQELPSNRNWRGLFAFDLHPKRKMVIESPHPIFDGTKAQGISLYFETDSLAFMQSGTHRNNLKIPTPCDGTQTSGDPYWISDMAHSREGFFEVAHEQLHRRYADTVSLSVHGMATNTDPSNVDISNGTGDTTTGSSLSRNLARRMNEILDAASDSRYAVSHQEPGEEPALAATTDTQGRYSNGMANPCSAGGTTALTPERFIHMEQDADVRNPPASNWTFVTQTLNELIPQFPALVPGPDENGDPIIAYPLDGDAEEAGGGATGQLIGSVAPAQDRAAMASAALEFPGASYVEIPDFSYPGADLAFTVTFWYRAAASTNQFQYLLSHGSIGSAGETTLPSSLHMYLTGSDGQLRVRFTLADGRKWNFDGPTGLADGEWHFVALTCSPAAGSAVYIDGQSVGTNAGQGGWYFDPEGSLILGGRSDLDAGRFLGDAAQQPGRLDAFRVFNTSLSASEVDDLFHEAPPADAHKDGWAVQ